MESKTKNAPEFRAKVTPQQVKEQLVNDKGKAGNTQSEKVAKRTSQPATAENPKKGTKKAHEEKDSPLTFPANIRINAYGFIGMRKALLEALSWHKGMALKIDKNPDGSVTIRKA